MNRYIVTAGLLIILVACLFTFVNATTLSSDCLTIKSSAFEGGTPVCWRKPSPEFQRTINAEAFKLGYDVQPDGTYKKVVG